MVLERCKEKEKEKIKRKESGTRKDVEKGAKQRTWYLNVVLERKLKVRPNSFFNLQPI